MTITALPTAPQRTDSPDVFATRADAWVAAIDLWTTQANALAVEVDGYKDDAAQSVIDAAYQVGLAESQAVLALGYKNDAASSANSAASISGASKWISGTTYTEGVCVWSPIDFKTYRRKSTGSGTTDPSSDSTNWQSLITSSEMILISSANANNSVSIDFTGLSDLYYKYIVEYYGVDATNFNSLLCHVQTDGTWKTSGYLGVFFYLNYGTPAGNGSDNNAIISYGSMISTSSKTCGNLSVSNLSDTTKQKIIECSIRDTSLYMYKKQYYYNSYSAITGLRFILSAGNIASGTFKLYGLKA